MTGVMTVANMGVGSAAKSGSTLVGKLVWHMGKTMAESSEN